MEPRRAVARTFLGLALGAGTALVLAAVGLPEATALGGGAGVALVAGLALSGRLLPAVTPTDGDGRDGGRE